MSGKAKFRLSLMFALALVCGYVGWLFFRERDPIVPLETAERTYQDGLKLEKLKDFKNAAEKYDQANVLLEHSLKRLNGPHGLDKEKLEEVSGKVLYMKSLALRDKYYAAAAAAGKPLAEAKDSVTNQNFRTVLNIPDSKDREEATGCIRGAATLFLAKEYDVQLEALRLELMSTPIAWDQVEKLSRAILEIKPSDNRAKFMLAKFEFEQPEPGKLVPSAPERRSPERIRVAKRLVEEVKTDSTFPVWRTEFLNAQIHFWLMNRARDKRAPEFQSELATLDMLLLDEVVGAVPRIRRGEGMERLGAWDIDSVLMLHSLAADIAVETIRKKNLPDYSILAKVFRDTLAFCEKKLDGSDGNFSRPMLINVLLNVMSKSQSFLASQNEKEWLAGVELLRPLLREEFKSDRCDPYRVAQFAEILMREAQLRKSRGVRESEWVQLPIEAKKWLDDGLQFGKDHNLTNYQMAPFNMLAANILFFNTDKRENLEPFIRALELTKRHPQAEALALVLDGACDEREGRLEKARWKLTRALKIAGGEEEVRANASLANIYMAMGMPDHALVSLNQLAGVYDRFKDLSDLEKQWITQFLRQPRDYYALTAIANLESARKDIDAFYQKNPKARSFPAEIVKEREDRVKNLLQHELPRVTSQGFMTRISFVNYLTATRRRQLAENAWLELFNSEWKDRVELLTLKVGLMQVEAFEAFEAGNSNKGNEVLGSIDSIIEGFIQVHPTNESAKLYYALWLAQTKRNPQAREYLKKIADTTKLSPEFKRVLAAVTLSHNSSNSPMRLVKHMPRDPQIDHILFDIGRNIDTQVEQVRTELTRHESVGIGRVMLAEELYAKDDYYASAEAFAGTLDFTRIKAMAQHGVIRSMFALAAQDSDKALALNMKLLNEFPREPALHLTYAYVFLVRDEIGNPTDNWEVHGRKMGSALNVWAQHMKDEAADNDAMIALTKAEFWFRANRMDVARELTQKALSHDARNPNVLVACINMILDDPAQERDPNLRGYIEKLKAIAADSGPERALTNFLSGRAEEFEGQWPRAIAIYEETLKTFNRDRNAFMRLVNLLDMSGDYAKALKWAQAWRTELPNDLNAVSAQVRLLCRLNQGEPARLICTGFLADAVARANALAVEQINGPDAAKVNATREKAVESARCQAELELANAFFLGGDLAEAEKRIMQLPPTYLNTPITQEILGEVYVKQKQWAKAEAVFTTLVQNDRSNLVAVNNLAYLLAEHAKQPSKARDIILRTLKGNGATTSRRSADRFTPEFLATIGTVYMRLDSAEYGKEMMEFFKSAEERYPNDPRIKLTMGYAHELAGDLGRAGISYDSAVSKLASRADRMPQSQREALIREIDAARQRLAMKRRASN